jgi:glycolate oxidase
VLGLEAFLMGGQRLFCGRRTVKGVTGYDVVGLLVGSEGTLAVIGDVTLRLRHLPEEVRTLLGLFRDSASAMKAVGEIIARGVRPRCVEFLDDGTLAAMRAAGNPLPENAGALLLIEVDGEPAVCEKESARIADVCDETRALELLIARDGAQRERLWAARREMSPAVRKMASYKLSEDVVVPRQALGALLEDLRRQSELLGIRTVVYGHAGDGNMHANFLWDSEDELPKVQQGIVRLFQKVIDLGGTLSGEHGIGVLKAPFLPLEQSPDLIALQRDLKRVFDPEGLLNPGKIFPQSGHRAC